MKLHLTLGKGPRFSIALKLSLTTGALLALVAVLSGLLQLGRAYSIHDAEARRRRASRRAWVRTIQVASARREAQIAQPRIVAAEWQILQLQFEQLVRNNPDIDQAAVVSVQRGTAVVHSDPFRVNQPFERDIGPEVTVFKEHDRSFIGVPLLGGRYALWLVFGDAALEAELRGVARQRRAARKTAIVRSAELTAAVLVLGIALSALYGLGMSRSIRRLALEARRIAGRELGARSILPKRGELGELAHALHLMADETEKLLEEAGTKSAFETELGEAAAIQQALLPRKDILRYQGIEVAGACRLASLTGGDWWQCMALEDGRLVIILGEVAGEGAPAAVVTVAAKSCWDTVRTLGAGEVPLDELLRVMNIAIRGVAGGQMPMTVFAATVDPTRREITYAVAGPNFPYVVRDAGRSLSRLASKGNRLGESLDGAFSISKAPLQAGDLLVMNTSGLVECASPGGEEFGDRRLQHSIMELGHLPVTEVRDGLLEKAFAFCGSAPRRKDVTLVIVRARG